MDDIFRKIATRVSRAAGSAKTFTMALFIVITWAVTGPLFHYSTTWQLFINTFTTIATFLMVFLIQNTQNRENKALHLKLDELLKGVHGSRFEFLDIEELSDQQLEAIHQKLVKDLDRHTHELKKRGRQPQKIY